MSGHWQGSNRRSELPADWARRRARILKRDHHRCVICAAPATDVDHIVDRHDHRDANLQSLCALHHKLKTQAEGRAARATAPRISERRPRRAHPGLR